MSIIFQTVFNLLRKKQADEKRVPDHEEEDLTYASGEAGEAFKDGEAPKSGEEKEESRDPD